jgi:hypothetical protein
VICDGQQYLSPSEPHGGEGRSIRQLTDVKWYPRGYFSSRKRRSTMSTATKDDPSWDFGKVGVGEFGRLDWLAWQLWGRSPQRIRPRPSILPPDSLPFCRFRTTITAWPGLAWPGLPRLVCPTSSRKNRSAGNAPRCETKKKKRKKKNDSWYTTRSCQSAKEVEMRASSASVLLYELAKKYIMY